MVCGRFLTLVEVVSNSANIPWGRGCCVGGAYHFAKLKQPPRESKFFADLDCFF